MQTELFTLDVDNRIKNMQTYIKIKLYRTLYWFPDAKEIVEIGEKFKVTGRLPLDCFISIAKEYIKFMEENLDTLYDDDLDYFDENAIQDHKKIIAFYQKRLNME
jgi:hypothetical protein